MTHHFRTDLNQQRYRRLGGQFSQFYTDTLFQGNICAQVYVNSAGFTKLYPVTSKSKACKTLSSFIYEVGIPHSIHNDDAKELTQGKMKEKYCQYKIYNTQNEPYSPCRTLQKML